jgi:hypothetical protein
MVPGVPNFACACDRAPSRDEGSRERGVTAASHTIVVPKVDPTPNQDTGALLRDAICDAISADHAHRS